ncbi:UDP-N-acetylmuramoyl-L-alanyl-D-glutamate--2,6-diaminopimelate ligase [Gammaproteobacteria bacterium]|nr:UDP-N-acetylmuramoyl-L-alanyl-D-glutamate--2,6-diaminopimelate ligase [Gammaproteobacteria bacterium]
MNTAEQLNSNGVLLDLINGLVSLPDPVPLAVNIVATGIQMDSRLLQKGDLFLACFGNNHDAREYINGAVEMGVAAVLAESGGEWQGVRIIQDVAVIAIDNLSAKLGEIAARFYSHPSRRLSVIGITGTNGKTSCSQFIAQALASSGFSCGTMGTLGYGVYGKLKETQLTTPDPVFTQMALAEMAQDGIDPVVMEVSSVGLHQRRVKAVKFDTAIFTNLTRDHLDYHESMDDYGDNKKKLFTTEGLSRAIINLDDPYALSVINAIAPSVDVCTYSLKNSAATVYAESLSLTQKGFEARIVTPIGAGTVKGKLLGYFNVSNLMAVITTLINYLPKKKALDIEQLCELVSGLSPVDGRMEIISDFEEITAVVDYAHTPEGLRSALKGLRDHFSGNIWCVFGCGGNRDKGKRPIMGEIAEAFADRLIIADDNPRNEEGDDIVQHILSGMSKPEQALIERDREKAIAYAIANAEPGDVVVVAGKGHETCQDVGGSRLIFSDANQVRLALQAREKK